MMNSAEVFLSDTKVCCISDVHIGIHQNSNQWHEITLNWAQWLRAELQQKGIHDIIISGDFFHYRDEIAVNTIGVWEGSGGRRAPTELPCLGILV